MNTTKVLFTVLLLVSPAAGLAQDGPTFDCAEAESSAERLICDDPALAALDRRLAARYAAALDVARVLDTGAEDAMATLRAYQRGWISGRDDCWKAPDLRACIEREYLFREGQLVAEFLLGTPSDVVEYACGGSQANTFTVYFFDTELPSVRVERGDTVDVGAAAGPDRPGTYYLRDLGNFTASERGATLTDPFGAVTTCEIAG